MEFLESCPVCKRAQFEPFLNCVDYTVSKEQFSLVRCVQCSFVFTNPRPAMADIGRYYESAAYTPHSGGDSSVIAKLYREVRKIALKNKLQLITRLCPNQGGILDYGCGSGEFLQVCTQAGWKTLGVDASETARKIAKEQNLQVITPEELSRNKQSYSFDIISLWHVLEHLHDLHGTLALLKGILSSNGWLLIAVPNRDSNDAQFYQQYWAAYDVPRHLYHFRPQDMEALLNQHQLEIAEFLPMPFDAYYVSLLSEQYQNVGIMRFPKAFWSGLWSNIAAHNNAKLSASVLYLIRHKL